jgi:hypothetical protein
MRLLLLFHLWKAHSIHVGLFKLIVRGQRGKTVLAAYDIEQYKEFPRAAMWEVEVLEAIELKCLVKKPPPC